jgi:hypothetical protein
MKQDAVDQVEISSPCTVPWSSMRGDGRIRFCGQCRQNVYNVEAFGRAEARRLVAESEGQLCVRILRRSDGTVVTADCWTRLRAARRRGIAPFLAMLLVVAWAELVAIRVGLGGWRRFVAKPPVPAPSFVADNRHLGDRHIMGGFPRKVIRSKPEPDWLLSKQGREPGRASAPHLSPPLVNPVLAGLPD